MYMPKECLDDDMNLPKILDLVLWVPKQHVYQVSLKPETVGFKFSVILGDLTRNDPLGLGLAVRVGLELIILGTLSLYYYAHSITPLQSMLTQGSICS